MKKIFYIGLLCLTLSACFKAEIPNLQGTPASLTLTFNALQNDIETRAVSPDIAETRIFNLYVFVFNKDGSIDYQKFHNLENSVAETHTLSIEQLTCSTGKSVVVIVNTNEANSILNVPEATLNAIKSRTELENLVVEMRSEAIERGTNFLMSGIVENVTVSPDGATQLNVPLRRVDAKIRFNVTTKTGVTFTHSDWRVVSVPRKISVMDKNPYLCTSTDECFNTDWAKFEDGGATFAFYSMEHLPIAKKQIPATETYALREKQEKATTGEGINVINGAFVYAPATGTYIEMRGNVTYEALNGGEISADVIYTVHLGGLVSFNDYNTRRNTFYTYNVKIISVDKIEIEVASSDKEDEQRPGAEGDVTAAKIIKNLDAHNEIFTLKLNESDIDKTLTWNVSTPFSKGSEAEQPTDYKWIYFRINDKTDNVYAETFQIYLGSQNVYQGELSLDSYMADITNKTDKMLDVKQLVALLKESKNNGTNLFDKNNNVNFTAFVNEYYYETNPNNTLPEKGLWRKFTNQRQRVMNIMSDLKYSPDHESSKSNAVYSIRQNSIQTMYNRTLEEDFTAWGLQMIQDETTVLFDGNRASYVGDNRATDKDNGRKNTVALWNGETRWSDYLTQTNWTMHSTYNYAKYKCLRMNRDNNGDGAIDVNEVQWYLAAINQLTDMWIGEGSYDPAARLYKNTEWKEQYFVSSTVLASYNAFLNNKDDPQILWSSEGSSTGLLSKAEGTFTGVNAPVHYRCARNLGIAHDANIDAKPSDLAVYDKATGRISLKRLDAQSIRGYYQTTQELVKHHEREASNKPYWEFEVQNKTFGDNYTWQTLHDYIQTGGRPCPVGFRIPNQRELALMLSRIGDDGNWTLDNHFSRTSFQFGSGRPGFAVSARGEILFLVHGASETGGVRCVKDYKATK